MNIKMLEVDLDPISEFWLQDLLKQCHLRSG